MPENLSSRQGLTENGAGQIACPVCHDPWLRLLMITYGSSKATTVVSADLTKVSWLNGEGPDDQYMAVLFECPKQHQFRVEMRYVTHEDDVTIGVTSFATKWEELPRD
jgi:hypothetical protein